MITEINYLGSINHFKKKTPYIKISFEKTLTNPSVRIMNKYIAVLFFKVK